MNKFVFLAAGLLAVLSLQGHAQEASDLAPFASLEETDAPDEARAPSPSPQAVGGGMQCFDVFVDKDLVAGERATATLSCPSNSVATGGGATSSFNEGLFINATGPTSGTGIDPNTWFTSAENYRSGGINVRFYARCCRVL